MNDVIDIGVSIPYRDSSFMDSIMQTTDNKPQNHNQEIMSDDEFDKLMEEWGIESECFKR